MRAAQQKELVGPPAPARRRGFSTDVTEHHGIVHSLARKIFTGLAKTGISVQFDDVVQETYLAFLKAAEGYDPSKGITFTAYAGRAAYNNVFRAFNSTIRDRLQSGIIYESECTVEDDHGNPMTQYALHATDGTSVEQTLEKEEIDRLLFQVSLDKLRCMTEMARKVIRETLYPSESMQKLLTIYNAKVSEKERCTHGFRFVVVALQLDADQVRSIREEIYEQFSVRF